MQSYVYLEYDSFQITILPVFKQPIPTTELCFTNAKVAAVHKTPQCFLQMTFKQMQV
jgi:hypothetical protein